VKATLKAVQDDLKDDDEDLAALGETIAMDDPCPFTYDGSMMIEDGPVPSAGYDVSNFDEHTSVGVEVLVLGYQMDNKEPGYSVSMCAVYHLGNLPEVRRPGSAKVDVLSALEVILDCFKCCFHSEDGIRTGCSEYFPRASLEYIQSFVCSGWKPNIHCPVLIWCRGSQGVVVNVSD
jgi:hypothetical protein